MAIVGHTLGFPRIGLYRELKFSLEKYWSGEISQDKLMKIGRMLRFRHWKQQIDAGLDLIPVGDFSWYDHVLTMSTMLNNIPSRYFLMDDKNQTTMDVMFRMARGCTIGKNIIKPLEMKKWFNTNYHYIVPEFVKNQEFELNWTQLFDELDESLSLKNAVKPVLLGPISYLWLGKIKGKEFNRLSLLPSLLLVYSEILDILSKRNIDWVQIDEPILVLELPIEWKESYISVYQELKRDNIKLLLTTYFDGISHQLDVIKKLLVDGLHVDLVSNTDDVLFLHEQLPKNWVLSAGVVNGRNIWKTNLYDWFNKLRPIAKNRELWIASSCSLLHSPIDINVELQIDIKIKSWFAFALQKCVEIKILCDALNSDKYDSIFDTDKIEQYYVLNNDRSCSDLVHDYKVKERCKYILNFIKSRVSYASRSKLQHNRFNLPLYPTTTIGSFPQTKEIRDLRLNFKNNQISKDIYCCGIKKHIEQIIVEQEKLGLDVLVHGEPERNDMVEYFADHLKGFVFTDNGWVQSYGSRCVKPPIIIGDISRPHSITKEWINYAQSLTKKPVKGILTGPVTIMSWSFIREDITKSTIAFQLALSIHDEVVDLENSGVGIIQIDEPALREGLPLKFLNRKNI